MSKCSFTKLIEDYRSQQIFVVTSCYYVNNEWVESELMDYYSALKLLRQVEEQAYYDNRPYPEIVELEELYILEEDILENF